MPIFIKKSGNSYGYTSNDYTSGYLHFCYSFRVNDYEFCIPKVNRNVDIIVTVNKKSKAKNLVAVNIF